MGLFSDIANRPDQPVQDVSNAPMTQEQFAQQNPNSSNPDYDYMLYQMQQQNDAKAQADAQLQQTDPHAYAVQKTQELADAIFTSFTNNGHGFGGTSTNESENRAALEAFKQTDPSAYYNAALSLNLKQAGWDAGQNKTNADTNATIQNLIQGAQASGISADQINNLVANNYSNTAQWHAQNIAQSAGQGAFLQGIEKVAPAFAAMITAGALAPAAAALEAGTAAATVAPEIAGSGFYTGAGFGGEALGTAAPTIGAAGGELTGTSQTGLSGVDSVLNAPDVQISSFGTGMPSGAAGGITAPLEGSGAISGAGATTIGGGGLTGALPANVMVGDGTLGTTIGATYASSAPGQFALDASGVAIPASSVGIGGFAPSTGLSLADVLKTANQVKQGISTASTLAKLLGGSAATGGTKTGSATTGTATPTTGGLSQQQLAQYLSGMSSPVQAAVPGQIKMNQNPFTFDIPGQTQASQGMYDVSGVHPMANALRKA